MGEVMPLLIVGFAILVIIVIVMAKAQANRKVVMKPIDQEDMVERIKIKLTGYKAICLAQNILRANDESAEGKEGIVEIYDGNGRLFRFEIENGERREK